MIRLTRYMLICLFCFPAVICKGQNKPAGDGVLKAAASEIMNRVKYCALITLDSTGRPQARTMDPFTPDDDFIIWFGTNAKSRKVAEIKNDPRVAVYYGDPDGNGYVVITGSAVLVNDPAEKEKHWKERWARFYPDRDKGYILIKVIPKRLEVVSYKHGLTGDTITWRAPNVEIDVNEK